jgi:hypothetical protein
MLTFIYEILLEDSLTKWTQVSIPAEDSTSAANKLTDVRIDGKRIISSRLIKAGPHIERVGPHIQRAQQLAKPA